MNEKDSYLGNSNLKKSNVQVSFTQDQITEYAKCMKDPIYFIKKYIKIVNVDEGLVPFETYPFQETLINTINDNRFTIAKVPRQMGKSTCITAYCLHQATFAPNQNIAILANKEKIAKDLLHKIKVAHEFMPKWLQQGIVEWNKGSILFENGSRIVASATSSSAIRGGSYNLIVLDEFAYVAPNIADEFYSSVYPTISSGKQTKVVIISTPKGLNLYYKMWIEAVEKRSMFVPFEAHWSEVPGRNAEWRETQIRNIGEEMFKVEFECDFIGSTNTLISTAKLKSLAFKTPIYKTNDGLCLYEKPVRDEKDPKNNHTYVMTVDTSRGAGGDFHAFCVIDITKSPYKIVATFKNNEMSPLLYPNVIVPVAKQYNNAYILVEINDIGGQVADLIHNEFEYENLLMSTIRGRKGQTLDGGFGASQTQLGLRTTKAVKRLGCSILKSLIEGDKLLIEDYAIINELVSFVSKNHSFEADMGHHDDLVMCMVLFSWLTTQNYFKDLTNMDIRKNLFQDKMENLEEEVTPFGFVEDGSQDQGFYDNKGNYWKY